MSEDNKTITRHIFDEVWGAYNVNKVEQYFAPNYINHPEMPGMPKGNEGVKAQVRMFASAVSDNKHTIEDLLADGDKVVIRWSATAKQTGELVGIPATGKQFKVTAINIYRFVGGKVVEGWNEYDSLGMMQQLGAIPAPMQAAK